MEKDVSPPSVIECKSSSDAIQGFRCVHLVERILLGFPILRRILLELNLICWIIFHTWSSSNSFSSPAFEHFYYTRKRSLSTIALNRWYKTLGATPITQGSSGKRAQTRFQNQQSMLCTVCNKTTWLESGWQWYPIGPPKSGNIVPMRRRGEPCRPRCSSLQTDLQDHI